MLSNATGRDQARLVHRRSQYSCHRKAVGFEIDYKRLLAEFQSRGTLVRAFYYTAIIEDAEFSAIRPLIDWLEYNGFHGGDETSERV